MTTKIFLTAILLIGITIISSNLFSQQNKKQNKTPEEMATKMTNRLKEKLSLNDEQYKQVYNIALSHAQERISNKEKLQSMDKASRKELMKQNHEGFKKQLEEILTPDQLIKMKEMKSKHKHERKNKDDRHKNGKHKNRKELK